MKDLKSDLRLTISSSFFTENHNDMATLTDKTNSESKSGKHLIA